MHSHTRTERLTQFLLSFLHDLSLSTNAHTHTPHEPVIPFSYYKKNLIQGYQGLLPHRIETGTGDECFGHPRDCMLLFPCFLVLPWKRRSHSFLYSSDSLLWVTTLSLFMAHRNPGWLTQFLCLHKTLLYNCVPTKLQSVSVSVKGWKANRELIITNANQIPMGMCTP